ncbi:MAG: hypothetical protein ACTSO5_07870 [Candidatus Heimdallarchaeaceae archaeon]
MPNNAFNMFVIILGFSLLGMPIIFISLSTAPPGLDDFQSTIIINSVPGDSQSAIYLNNTANINGSTIDIWDDISGLPELSNIYNITQLILNEQSFMDNVTIEDYSGFSKLVHVFILEMTIDNAPTSIVARENYVDLFGSDNGTFISWMWAPDEWNSSYYTEPNYPEINNTIDTVYLNHGVDLEYEITVNFYANIDINGTQYELEFVRLIYLNPSGDILFFLTNETDWVTA